MDSGRVPTLLSPRRRLPQGTEWGRRSKIFPDSDSPTHEGKVVPSVSEKGSVAPEPVLVIRLPFYSKVWKFTSSDF